MTMNLRLAFNCGRWHPTKEQFMAALSIIQSEEKKRICDFVFQRDVKTALIGRLLIRHAIRKCLNMKNKEIILQRTEHGRPYLVINNNKNININNNNININNNNNNNLNDISSGRFDFNISHQDDLVVLACETDRRVGIDTMSLERPVGCSSTERFLDLMRRQLSNNEWHWIHNNNNNKHYNNSNHQDNNININVRNNDTNEWSDRSRLVNFFRIWCMKESYVKAIGMGIGYSLSRLDCHMVDDLPTSPSSSSLSPHSTPESSSSLPPELSPTPSSSSSEEHPTQNDIDSYHHQMPTTSRFGVTKTTNVHTSLVREVPGSCPGVNDPQLMLRTSFVKVDGRLANEWLFEETILMDKYLVTVAVEDKDVSIKTETKQYNSIIPSSFRFMTIDELLDCGGDDDDYVPLPGIEWYAEEWVSYLKKDMQPNKK